MILQSDTCHVLLDAPEPIEGIELDSNECDVFFQCRATLVHSPSFVMRAGMDIQCGPGDFALFRKYNGVIYCVNFSRADGQSVAAGQRVVIEGAGYDDRALRSENATLRQQVAQLAAVAKQHEADLLELRDMLAGHTHETIRQVA